MRWTARTRTRVARRAALATLALAAAGCGLMGPGSYDLAISGEDVQGLHALYVAVGKGSDLEPLATDDNASRVISFDLREKLSTFAELDPLPDEKKPHWDVSVHAPSDPRVTIDPSSKKLEATIEISRKLVEAPSEAVVLVAGDFGDAGWRAVLISTSDLSGQKGGTIAVQSAALVRR